MTSEPEGPVQSQPPAAGREPAGESELVVAIFRTAFLLVVILTPTFLYGGGRYRNALYLSVNLAGIYNLVLLYLHWRRYHFRRQRLLIVAVDLLIITSWVYLSQANYRMLFPLYYLVVVVAGLWFGVVGTLVTATAATGLYLATLAASLPQEWGVFLSALSEQIPFLFLIALLVGYMADIQRRERQSWYEARFLLAQYQERMRIAQSIYELLRPSQLRQVPGLDVGVRFRPALRMGAGDYYELIELGPRRYGICIADVAGKFTTGMLKVPLFKYALLVAARVYQQPAQVLTRVNELVFTTLQPDMFISMCYLVADLDRMKLTWASAGHDPVLLLPGAGGEPVLLESTGLVLGALADPVYRQNQSSIHPDDTLVLYTDGATGALDAAGEEFGLDRLIELAHDQAARLAPADQVAGEVFNRINEFARGGQRRDDISLLVIRIKDQRIPEDQPPEIPQQEIAVGPPNE